MNRLKIFSLVITSLCLVGCGGGPDLPDLGTVSGVVTVDGNPLPGVVVTFEPEAGGRNSTGTTNEQGEYSLTYSPGVSGALVGKHKVMITTPTEAPDPSGRNQDPIPPHYNTDTTLVEEVSAGSNDIPLKLSM